MKIAILILGTLGAILLILTVYSYMKTGKHFKAFAYSFFATAVALFGLVLIKNISEKFGNDKNRKEDSKQ